MHAEDSFELDEFKKDFKKDILKKEQKTKNKKNEKRLSVVIVILALLLVFIVWQIINYFIEAERNASIDKKVSELIETSAEYSDDLEAFADELVIEPEIAIEPKPVIEPEPSAEPRLVLDKITKLRELFLNNDIVAHLRIDGTNIDYAVAQSSNNEFYLNHDLYGEKNSTGSIFMDYECNAYELRRNTVIYGHNMRNGTMFHNLRYYRDKNYYEEHRNIYLTTPYEETVWEIFSFYETGVDFNYIQVVFPNNETFMSVISQMKEKSIYNTGVEVGESDKILTLSTCAYSTDNSRFVINAKLIETPDIPAIQ